jgi:hypothetical protein
VIVGGSVHIRSPQKWAVFSRQTVAMDSSKFGLNRFRDRNHQSSLRNKVCHRGCKVPLAKRKNM